MAEKRKEGKEGEEGDAKEDENEEKEEGEAFVETKSRVCFNIFQVCKPNI